MITVRSINATTFHDIESIFLSLVYGPLSIVVVKFSDDELTVEFFLDRKAYTLTMTIQETGEITEWGGIGLEGELFQAIAQYVSKLWCHEWFA